MSPHLSRVWPLSSRQVQSFTAHAACLPAGPLQLVLERVLTKAAQGTEDSQEYASVLHLLHHACHLRVRLNCTVLLCILVVAMQDTLLPPALQPVQEAQ